MRRPNSILGIILSVVVTSSLMLLTACGDDGNDSDTLSRDGSALEEQAADAVDSDGYCDRAQKAQKAPKNNKKVMICHIPPGNPANAHTIVVSKNAVRAHLAHGDVLGACGCDDEGGPGNGGPGNGNGKPGGGDDDDDHDHGDDDDHDHGYTPDGDPAGGDGSTDDGGGATTDGTPTGGSGSTSDGTTVDGSPTGGSGSTGDGTTLDGVPVDGSGSSGDGQIPGAGVCDADQAPCSSSSQCGFNAICDMNCCVWVLL